MNDDRLADTRDDATLVPSAEPTVEVDLTQRPPGAESTVAFDLAHFPPSAEPTVEVDLTQRPPGAESTVEFDLAHLSPSAEPTVEVDLSQSLPGPEPTLEIELPQPAPISSWDVTRDPLPSTVSEPAALPLSTADQIAFLEREVRARAGETGSAPLLYEIGRLWEQHLQSPRNAAIAYQAAFQADRGYLPNLQASRRLFAEVGNWPMVAQLLDAEIEAVEDAPTKARLLFARGEVLNERLSRTPEARASFERAIELDPTNLEILAYLEGILVSSEDRRALVAILIRSAEVLEDPRASAYAFAAAARLLEGFPDQRHRALELSRRAFTRDPSDPTVSAQLRRHLRGAGEHDELIRILQAELERAMDGSPAAAASTCHEIARLQLRMDREDDAVDSLLAALRLAPRDPLIATELSRIYELREAWDPLAEVLAARAGAAADEGEKITILLELAALLDSKMDQPARAIEQYRAVLRLAPGNRIALSALGKLQYQQGDWEGLLQTIETEALVAQDPKQKAAHGFKAAAVLEERLGKVEEAIDRYGAIFLVQPGYLPAQKALTRLYGEAGRYAELVAMIEQEVAGLLDRDQIIAGLTRVAEIQESKLEDPMAALESLRKILEVAPGHLPTIRAMARLAEQAKDWEALLGAHETEAAHTGDQRQVVSLLHRNAEILEEQLEDKARAIEAYRKVLSLAPAYLPALRALGRLYAQRGMWKELLRMHRREAEIASSPTAAATLVYQIAELYEHKLMMEEKAIDAYREVLTLSPSHFPAMASLARIHRSQGAWQHLVEILRGEASTRTDPREKAAVLFQIAELCEDHLQDAIRPEDAYAEVLRVDPAHLFALRALERIHAQAGDWPALAGVLERMGSMGEASERVVALSQLVALQLDLIGDPSGAARVCEAALALAPNDLFLLKSMERIRSIQRDPGRRAELRETLASEVLDPRLSAALLLQAAADRQRSSPSESSQRPLEQAVDADPRSEHAREVLERTLTADDDPIRLAVLLERRAEAATDPALHVALLLRLGELRETRLGDPEAALSAYRDGLQVDPSHLPTLAAAARLVEHSGDLAELRQLLLLHAAAERAPTHVARTLIRIGEISEALGETEAAAAYYREALQRLPADPLATTRLEQILTARGDAGEVAGLYEARAARESDPVQAAESLVAAARLQMDTLADLERAAKLLDEAIAKAPEHVEALERRGVLGEALRKPSDAIEAFSARLRLGGDPLELAPIHYRVAQHLAAAGDGGRALTHLHSALAADPSLREPLILLARLHVDARNWPGAVEALRRLESLEKDPVGRNRIQEDLARVLEEGMGDLEAAAACLERVLEASPEDERTLERLCRLYERARDLESLAGALGRWSDVLARGGRAERASAVRARAGAIYAGPLRDPIQAASSYQKALEWNGDDREIRTALADLYAQDPKFFDVAIQEYRLAIDADPRWPGGYRSLFRIWREQEQRDRAFVAASVLHFLRAADRAESGFYTQFHGLLPAQAAGAIASGAADRALTQLVERSPMAAIVEALEERIAPLAGVELGRWEVERDDRLRADHPLRRQIDRIFGTFGMDPSKVAAYITPRAIAVEPAIAPQPTLVIGRDFTSAHSHREQTFLLSRMAWMIRQGSSFYSRLTVPTLEKMIVAAVRIHAPGYDAGPVDDDATRRLAKAMGRKGRKALEQPVADFLSTGGALRVDELLRGARRSANRAGMTLSGDVPACLGLLLREGSGTRGPDGHGELSEVLERREDIVDLLRFSIAEEHFRLRGALRLGLP